MGPSPILPINNTITIGAVLNFNGGNNGPWLKTSRVNRPSRQVPLSDFFCHL